MQKLIYGLSCTCINSRYTSNEKDGNPETTQCLSRNEAPDICSVFRRGDSPLTEHYLLLHITSADFSDVIFFHTLCLLFNTLYMYMYILILMHCGVVDSG